MSLKSNIHIHVHLPDGTPAPKVSKKTTVHAPEKEKDADVEKGAALDVKLQDRDSLNEEELMALEEQCGLYARDLIKNQKMEVLRKWLADSKHHLSDGAKALIADEIRLSKVNV